MNNFKTQLSKIGRIRRYDPLFDPKLTEQKNFADPRKERIKVENFHRLMAAISPKSMELITKDDIDKKNKEEMIPASFKRKQHRIQNSLRGRIIYKN